MNLHNVASSHSSDTAQTMIIFCTQDEKKIHCDCTSCGCENALHLIKRAHEEGRFKGASKETVFFRSANIGGFEHYLFVGLGNKRDVNESCLRSAMAVAVKTLTKEKTKSASVCLHSVRKLTRDARTAGRAMSEGALLGTYKYTETKSKKKDANDKSDLNDLTFSLSDKNASKTFGEGVDVGTILAGATNIARDLGNAPSNWLTPTILAERAKQACKGLPIKFQALNKKQIQALKMGCFLGVNYGSAEEPRFIIMEYRGAKRSDKPVVLVGKGITFDTGGISIKPAAGMEEMKFDMCGAAAVIGAIVALARLKAKVNVVTLVPTTENMPDGRAIKPGDVVTAMNGKTVEVNNTDAEGRLILADALAYACSKYKPAAIIDAATLTGACVIALGNVFAGFFCKDKKFVSTIQDSAEKSGERIWQLPLVDEYVDDMKGTYADLSNMGSAKGGGSSQGAAFLSQFVDDGILWAHFDIAGSAYNTGSRYPFNPDKGASGSAVRLFAQIALSFQ